MSVSLAAAEHPPASGSSSLASLVGSLRQNRAFFFCFLFLPPLAGIALTALSIVWHRHKVRADRAIAWFTGRVWLEVKLLLLVPFLWACALAGMCCLAALMGECSPTALCATSPSPWPCGGLTFISTTCGTISDTSRSRACAPPVCACSGGRSCATPPPSGPTDG